MNKCVNLQNLDSSKNFVLSFKPNVNLLTGLFFQDNACNFSYKQAQVKFYDFKTETKY